MVEPPQCLICRQSRRHLMPASMVRTSIGQESKDRLRAENDYRVNLKAELEIRHLHSKMDMLLTHQWQRLLEIQQIQTELIQQIAQREDPADPRTSN